MKGPSKQAAIAAGLALLISGAVSAGTSEAMAREAEPQSSGVGEVAVVVDGAVRHQTIDGFGQAEPSVLVHPVPESLGAKQRAAGVDKAYRQVGINLGIIGSLLESPGGWDHLQNDNADPFTINWSGFDPEYLTLAKKYVVDLEKPYGFTNYYLGAEAPNIRWASPWLAGIRGRNSNTYLDEVAEQVLANVAYWKNTYGEELPYYQLGNEQLSGNRCMIDPVRGGYGPVDPVQQMVDIAKRAGARLRQDGFRKTRFMVGTEETEYVSLRRSCPTPARGPMSARSAITATPMDRAIRPRRSYCARRVRESRMPRGSRFASVCATWARNTASMCG